MYISFWILKYVQDFYFIIKEGRRLYKLDKQAKSIVWLAVIG